MISSARSSGHCCWSRRLVLRYVHAPVSHLQVVRVDLALAAERAERPVAQLVGHEVLVSL